MKHFIVLTVLIASLTTAASAWACGGDDGTHAEKDVSATEYAVA